MARWAKHDRSARQQPEKVRHKNGPARTGSCLGPARHDGRTGPGPHPRHGGPARARPEKWAGPTLARPTRANPIYKLANPNLILFFSSHPSSSTVGGRRFLSLSAFPHAGPTSLLTPLPLSLPTSPANAAGSLLPYWEPRRQLEPHLSQGPRRPQLPRGRRGTVAPGLQHQGTTRLGSGLPRGRRRVRLLAARSSRRPSSLPDFLDRFCAGFEFDTGVYSYVM
jgi:hypothetical protein